MAKELIWSNEDEYVYGRQAEFASKEDFSKTVKDQYENGDCTVIDITIEPCLYSERTIPGDHLVPLSLVDYCIENYYMAKIVPVDSDMDDDEYGPGIPVNEEEVENGRS